MATTVAPLQSPPQHHPGNTHARHRHSSKPASSRLTVEEQPDPRRRSAPAQTLTPTHTAASPEVINLLVDQLSKLSPSPLHNPFLYGSLAPQGAGRADVFPGSGGVVKELDSSGGYLHPDDAAIAPVVRTSKPPSGFSSHTRGDSISHSRRSSFHSGGGSVGTKGGVDIPSYVRTYMNREVSTNNNNSNSNSNININSTSILKTRARMAQAPTAFLRRFPRPIRL